MLDGNLPPFIVFATTYVLRWWNIVIFDNLGSEQPEHLGSVSFVSHNLNYKIEILFADWCSYCCDISRPKMEV
jgi:hypothetical protein